jgi:hypothetical protein
MGVQYFADKGSKIPAAQDSRLEARGNDVFAADPSEMRDYVLSVLAAKHKPRISLVGNASIGGNTKPTLKESRFYAVKLRKLLLTPVLGVRGGPPKR